MAFRVLQSCVLLVAATSAAGSQHGAQGELHSPGSGHASGSETSLVQASVRQTSELTAQSSSGVDAAARKGPVECVPGETLNLTDLHSDILVPEGLCRMRGVSTTASVIVSGGASLIMEGPDGRVDGFVKVESSRKSNIFLLGVEVGGVTVRNAGNVEIRNGSLVGPVEVLSSGSLLISDSSVFDVVLSDSGDVVIVNGSDVGDVEATGSGSVTISGGSQITSVNAEMCKSVSLSGGVSVEREVDTFFIEGTVELDNVTVGGTLTLDKSPGTNVQILASKVPEMTLSIAGDLYVASGSELGTIEVKGSGHVQLIGSAASEVMISDSGNLTLSAGSTVRDLDLDRSGHLSIAKDVALRRMMCKSSGGITMSDNVAVEGGIEAFNVQGSLLVSGSTVGGPLSVISASGDIVVDGSTVHTEGLMVEKCAGSVGLRASSIPSFDVKGVSGDIAIVDMQAKDLRLEGVEGEVIFSGVKTSGSSMFNNIGGGVVCPSVQPVASWPMAPSATSLVMPSAGSWADWLQSFLWPAP